MRMWMLPIECMCKKHIAGEHGELHKFLPTFRKGISVDGRFKPVVQIQFQGYVKRHDELAKALNHKSPMVDVPDFQEIYPRYHHLTVDQSISAKDLSERCEDCRKKLLTNGFI